MKKRIIIVLLSLCVGGCLSYYIFNNRVKAISSSISYVTVKAFQIGYYSNYDNALRVADRNNGIVVNDNGMYRVYNAILYNNDCIKLISNYYDSIGLNYFIREIDINSKFIDDISIYEDVLLKSSSISYSSLLLDILKVYGSYL